MLRAAWARRLEGALFPAVPVPFTADGRIDQAAQESYVAHMAKQHVAGVAVWAHTGRGLMLTPDQRRTVLRSWRQGLPEGAAIVAGAGGPDSVAMAEAALADGADLIMAYAPSWLRGKPESEILRYHQELADLGAPLLLFYLYEAAGGISYSPALLDELMAIPNVVGIKMATLDSIMTYQDVANQLRTAHPDVTLITGEDRFLGYSLMCGARGALIGMGAACTGIQHELIQSYLRGEYDRFMALNAKVDAYAQATFVRPMEGYIQKMLVSLALQGVIPTTSTFDPWGPGITKDEIVALERVMKSIGEVR